MKKILITGGTGYAGASLIASFQKSYDIFACYHNSNPLTKILNKDKWIKLDLASSSNIKKIVKEIKPEVLIHTAAIATINVCDNNPKKAYRINVEGTKKLLEECAPNTKFIYLSTDLVFDGIRGNYSEKDIPSPKHYYGETKYFAEQEIQKIDKNWVILRCALMYGTSPSTHNTFFTNSINKIKNGEAVTFFLDEYRTPLFLNDLSLAIEKIIKNDAKGIFHVGGREKLSRLEFAKIVAEVFSLNKSLIKSAKVADMPNPEKRARDCSLNIDKMRKELSWEPGDVRSNLKNISF
ncbi:MAG: SDR family oxidoreductase [Candidatus Margulisbacteria bacterium]|nr:SDR family oxidoreductase [Candidatus Margulisiibacteriota bacterium]